MIDYLQAGEIRRQYPEFLTDQNISDIISEWDKRGIERIDMLYFSSMFIPKSNKLNISEFELTLRAHSYFKFKELEPIGSKNFYGMLAVTFFENLTEYQNPYEVEKETFNLRLKIGEEFLKKCVELDSKELSKGFKTMRNIRSEVSKKYKIKKHPWQKQVDNLVNSYIL